MHLLRMLFLCGVLFAVTACSPSNYGAPEDAIGVWGSDNETHSPHVSLAFDGTVAGSDGCNRMMDTWRWEKGRIYFGEIATTLMYCEGVDTSLNGMRSAKLAGDTMEFYDEAGEQHIVSLPRTSTQPLS